MVKRITLKKVDAPSGCTIDTSGTLIVDNEPEYEIHSEDEGNDDESSEGILDYDSCHTSDNEEVQQHRTFRRPTFVPAKLNMKEYEDDLEEETDFKVIKKKPKKKCE